LRRRLDSVERFPQRRHRFTLFGHPLDAFSVALAVALPSSIVAAASLSSLKQRPRKR
jgi:hypothetical protein